MAGLRKMKLAQQLLASQELRMELTGGSTDSIFPDVERWLKEDSDRYKVLHAIRSFRQTDTAGTYQSVVDYIFASVFPEWRKHVFRFYKEKGPRMMHMVTNEERLVMQGKMIKCLEVLEGFRKARTSWSVVRTQVRIAA